MPTQTQLPDGRWVPAQPMPYFRDTRPVYVKLWHVVKGLAYLLLTKRGLSYLVSQPHDRNHRQVVEAWHAIDDKLEADMDKWSVPVEPYTDEDGKWHYL